MYTYKHIDRALLLSLLRAESGDRVFTIANELLKESLVLSTKGKAFRLFRPHAPHNGRNPLLVAHVDTCDNKPPLVNSSTLSWSNLDGKDCLGADDRAGVYACLYLAQALSLPLLLTDGEERGGIGASEVINSAPFLAFCDTAVSCLVEFDRQGCNSYVTYDPIPLEMEQVLKDTGLEEEYGTYSDIATIVPAVGIPGVNLATGYYRQHTARETLSLPALAYMIGLAEEVILPQYMRKDAAFVLPKRIQSKKLGSFTYKDFTYQPSYSRKPLPAKAEKTMLHDPWDDYNDDDDSTYNINSLTLDALDSSLEREPLTYCDYCGDLVRESELGEWVDEQYTICLQCETALALGTARKHK